MDEPDRRVAVLGEALIDRFPDRDNEYVPDRVGNLTLLTRSDKEHLGEIAPDVYLRIIESRDRSAHLIPNDDTLWTLPRYNSFCEQRERDIASMLRDLLFDLGI